MIRVHTSLTLGVLAAATLPVSAGDASPDLVGQWSEPIPWEVIGIHAAMLPTGEVLQWAYPTGSPIAMTWNPATGVFTPTDLSVDLFCAGQSLLSDGSVLVAGGNDPANCNFRGRVETNIYNPFTNTWTRSFDMAVARWYPRNLTLGDGSVLITSGLDLNCQITPVMERYIPGLGLDFIPEGLRYMDLFPWLYQLPDGRIVHVGPEQDTYTFQFGTGWQYIATTLSGQRHDGTSVLIPGTDDEFLIIGGHGFDDAGKLPPIALCERIDLSDPTPQWRPTGSLSFARAHADVVILPDGNVFYVGGGTHGLYGDPVLTPELYDPQAETWTPMAPHALGRMYHGTTVLLPDARVLCAGQDSGPSAFLGEIYSPPYLFKGPRPTIANAPKFLSHAEAFDIASPDAAGIESAVLVRMSAVTHSVNTGQRLVDLPIIARGASAISVAMPANPNTAPPGPYMLFILNAQGVPSVAEIVYVDHAPVACRADFAVPFGTLDFSDVLGFLTSFGAMESRADLAPPYGIFDFTDVIVFILALAEGCP